MKFSAFFISALLLSVPAAQANLSVTFDEGAPKDQFRIENTGKCTLTSGSILLDLSTSSAGLIFDVTGRGAGVEVFQPLEIIEGAKLLTEVPKVVDGQSKMQLDVDSLAPGQTISFTIDVDDTVGQREITVSNAEIAGATISYEQGPSAASAEFTNNAQALVAIADC
ncbi:MAG: aggregation factor core [Roseibium sp.]|uniref:aggregation factor core n=1 Tax=Roseibium sp. TaxID=1936156 RepID=UPI001B20017E|nr:aggregation factor core [Roseibium sp.]MBO6890943.1 aggregation factor core [Roseibium sp.]MBO6930459.1 aggregation factor core [Roseibium sp.]